MLLMQEVMAAATKLENRALSVRGCGLELSILCRKFRVELERMMVLEAKQIYIHSIATHRLVTLLAMCHVELRYVTIFVLHDVQNALGFLGNGRMHYYNFYCSFQDALRTFFQPIKTNDPRLDFYTMYKREATEYDADYVKKYDEDLNTALIFVRRFSSALVNYLTRSYRPVCSRPSAQLSSSKSAPTSNPIPTNNLPPSSRPSSSLSTSPPFPVRPPPFPPLRKIHRTRSSPPPA